MHQGYLVLNFAHIPSLYITNIIVKFFWKNFLTTKIDFSYTDKKGLFAFFFDKWYKWKNMQIKFFKSKFQCIDDNSFALNIRKNKRFSWSFSTSCRKNLKYSENKRGQVASRFQQKQSRHIAQGVPALSYLYYFSTVC